MTLKEEIKDILHPLRAPIVSEKLFDEVGSRFRLTKTSKSVKADSRDSSDSKPTIDEDLNLDEIFEWCAHNSSFRRWLIEFVKKVIPGFEGKYHRFSKDEMNRVFIEKRREVKQKIKSFDKNARNYQNVMNKFKEKLKKMKGV